MFFLGGVVGVFGFQWIGYPTAIFLSAMLFILAIMPLVDDIRARWRRTTGHF
jgi:uncharacterized membrane protein YoaK (UPF0700 family)